MDRPSDDVEPVDDDRPTSEELAEPDADDAVPEDPASESATRWDVRQKQADGAARPAEEPPDSVTDESSYTTDIDQGAAQPTP